MSTVRADVMDVVDVVDHGGLKIHELVVTWSAANKTIRRDDVRVSPCGLGGCPPTGLRLITCNILFTGDRQSGILTRRQQFVEGLLTIVIKQHVDS